jgi:hypothetical protein
LSPSINAKQTKLPEIVPSVSLRPAKKSWMRKAPVSHFSEWRAMQALM